MSVLTASLIFKNPDRTTIWVSLVKIYDFNRFKLEELVDYGNPIFQCTGVFYTPRVIITAAHCFPVRGNLIDNDAEIEFKKNLDHKANL